MRSLDHPLVVKNRSLCEGIGVIAPVSPASMKAIPTPAALNGFLFIQASPHASHTLSRHMGYLPPFARMSGGVGMQV